jgi:hypothetical protein
MRLGRQGRGVARAVGRDGRRLLALGGSSQGHSARDALDSTTNVEWRRRCCGELHGERAGQVGAAMVACFGEGGAGPRRKACGGSWACRWRRFRVEAKVREADQLP